MNLAAPPEWLSYAAPSVALAAFIVSMGAFVLAYLTYRRAGPKVTGIFSVGEGRTGICTTDTSFSALSVTIINSGLAAVQVTGFRASYWPPGEEDMFWRETFRIPNRLSPDGSHDLGPLEGPDLPASVLPNSSLTWHFEPFGLPVRAPSRSPEEIDGHARRYSLDAYLGNGRTLAVARERPARAFFGLHYVGTATWDEIVRKAQDEIDS